MGKRRYTRIKELVKEINKMMSEGKSHKEIEVHFGLQGDRPVHNFLKRLRRKEPFYTSQYILF